jgi:diguanylate cyclase (GGDEF)-like protein
MVAISSVLYAIIIAFFALQANQYKGIRLYMWGAISAALGFLLSMFIAVFPDILILRFFSSSFLILACYFYCLGIARFLNFKFNAQWLFYFLVLGIILSAYFLFFNTANGLAKILIIFFYGIVFYSIACYFLWKRRHENFASSIYFVLLSLVFIIIIFIINSYLVVVYQIGSLVDNERINKGILLAIFISGYLRNVGFIMMVSHRLYQDLRDAASIDFLTKIYNRRATQEILDQQFYQFQRYHNSCSIILLDIDHFKKVNDNYGHEIGDKVLQSVTHILKDNLRKTDTLGRWGGEEFLIILPNMVIEKAIEVAEKLKQEIAREQIEGINCTISLGVKTIDNNDQTIDQAVKRADDALYNAKHSGRNCVVAFSHN